MALALRVARGDVIYIGDDPLTVSDIAQGEPKCIWVDFLGTEYELTDMASIEVAPSIMVGCDFGGRDTPPTNRLLFEAPRDIPIKREALYGKPLV